MSYRKKLFTFLDQLNGSPLAQDAAVTRVASCLGTKPRLIKAEVKATKHAAAQDHDGPDIETATDDLFFDGTSYWRREVDHNYGKLGREDVMLELRRRGFSPKKTPGSEISRVEEAVHHVQTNARVVYAAPLCGRSAGRHIDIHRLQAEEVLASLGRASKLNADWDFLIYLHDLGAQVAEDWLDTHVK